MITSLYIISTLIIIIISYPIWLYFIPKITSSKIQYKIVEEVSLIFLSHNGGEKIEKKLSTLIKALKVYKRWELIIVDSSSDSETLNSLSLFKNIQNVYIVYNNSNTGVPNSMNLGVNRSKYKFLIFSDQRQFIENVNLNYLLSPLNNDDIGCVSAKISAFDKNEEFSFMRFYENFIKRQESKIGSVIGVYGPFFSIKKELYKEIPENIILDDLYLSLIVLQTKKILFTELLELVDDNFNTLYNKDRIRRYFSGLSQLLNEQDLFKKLPYKTQFLLISHKYIRLILPILFSIIIIILVFASILINLKLLLPFVIVLYFTFFSKTRNFFLSALRINQQYWLVYFETIKKLLLTRIKHFL